MPAAAGRPLAPALRKSLARRYAAGEAITVLAAAPGLDFYTVRRAVVEGGGALRTFAENNRRYALDEAAFDRAGPDVSYWLGFLTGDGYLGLRKGAAVVGLTQAWADRGHVGAFKAFLKSDHPVRRVEAGRGSYSDQPYAALAVCSAALAASLARRGLRPGKPNRVVPAEFADDADFFRGLVDADGSLYHGRDRRTGRDWNVNLAVCGSRAVCDAFAAFALRRLGPPHRGDAYPVYPIKSVWRTKVAGHRALRMAELLYADAATCLPRKKAAADALAALASNL